MAACATTTATTTTSVTSTSVATTTTTVVASTTTVPALTTSVAPVRPVTRIGVGDTPLDVWVAEAPEERQQGLRGVSELPKDVDGMLFVFPEPSTPNFIMEDTLIPLQVWFFDVQGILIGSHEMTPCTADPCPLYPAPGPVGWALETPLGARDFHPGDLLSTSASG